MKKRKQAIVIEVLVFCMLFSLVACESQKANNPGETTTQDQETLESAMKHDGLSDDDIRESFFVYTNGHYRKNVSKNPIVYYGYREDMSEGDLSEIMDYIKSYFKNNASGIPVKPEFKFDDTVNRYANATYNSISDKNLASMGCEVDGDFGGRVHYCYEKDRKGNDQLDRIQTFQIELPKKNINIYTNSKWEYVILHELGHGFGLTDVKDSDFKGESVMYYSTTGFDPRNPVAYFTVDAKALSLLYQ